MSNQVRVQVNVINQLKLLRQSTFKDKLSFLDEDIQNAQRAKASDVQVSIDYFAKKVTIENNGKVLQNPQALFSIAESEWDEDIQKTESPFGVGFFSNITVSDYIEVFSGDKHITFNVAEMIQNNNTEISVSESDEYYDGFKLVLNNFDFSQVTSSDIKERLNLLGRYIHELNIYCDNVLQDKKNLTEGDQSTFQMSIEDEPTFKGWVALNRGFSQDVKVFYKGRLVTKLDGFYYAKGDLHVSDKTLNLTSPDRKDIIRDSKYYDFVKQVKLYIQELANTSFINGKQSDIDQYIDSISSYADKNKIKNKMTFLVFDTENENDAEYLKGIALAKRDDASMKTLNDYEVYIKTNAAKQSESHFDEVEIESEVKSKAPQAEGVRYYSGSDSSTSKPEIEESELEERKGQHLDINEDPIFWLSFDEVIEQEGKFNIAKHYGLKVIVSRNKFESSVLEMLGLDQNVVHISQLTEKTKIKATISNTILSNKEQRALMLLDMISRIVGFNKNVFGIGDLMILKQTSVEVLNKTVEKIEDKFVAIYDSSNKKIYVDRIAIDKSKLRDDLDDNLDLDDYKFIMLNLKEIVRELGLIEFENGKPEDLYGQIINTLAVA